MRSNVGGQPGTGRDACASDSLTTALDDRGASLPACPECPSGQHTADRPATPREGR